MKYWFCFVLLLFAACKKEHAVNYATIHLRGRVFDSSFNRGLGGVPVRAYWQDGGVCYVCPELKAAAGETNSSGYFDFSFEDDTTKFGHYLLHVQATVPPDYISELAEHRQQAYSFRNNYDADLRKMWFVVYKKSPLTIVLKRTQSGAFQEFYLLYKFGPWWYNQVYNWETGPQPAPAQFDVSTGANRWTYVRWDKWFTSTVITSFEDSVYCAAGKANTITITY